MATRPFGFSIAFGRFLGAGMGVANKDGDEGGAVQVALESVTSSGDVADKLGQISEELRSVVLQLYALIIATTNALKNVHGSIVEADETAAQQIATGVVLK